MLAHFVNIFLQKRESRFVFFALLVGRPRMVAFRVAVGNCAAFCLGFTSSFTFLHTCRSVLARLALSRSCFILCLFFGLCATAKSARPAGAQGAGCARAVPLRGTFCRGVGGRAVAAQILSAHSPFVGKVSRATVRTDCNSVPTALDAPVRRTAKYAQPK